MDQQQAEMDKQQAEKDKANAELRAAEVAKLNMVLQYQNEAMFLATRNTERRKQEAIFFARQ